MKQDQTTTPGTPCPTLCEKCVGSLTSPANQYREDAGDGTYGLSSLSEKTRTSNRLRMSLQRQHILLSYFKTLSVGPVWGSNPRPPARQSSALPTELTRRRSGWDASPSQVTPSISSGFPFAGTHLYSWVERGTVRVKCLAKEHSTMTRPGL